MAKKNMQVSWDTRSQENIFWDLMSHEQLKWRAKPRESRGQNHHCCNFMETVTAMSILATRLTWFFSPFHFSSQSFLCCRMFCHWYKMARNKIVIAVTRGSRPDHVIVIGKWLIPFTDTKWRDTRRILWPPALSRADHVWFSLSHHFN